MQKSLWKLYKDCWTINYLNAETPASRREFWGGWVLGNLILWALIFLASWGLLQISDAVNDPVLSTLIITPSGLVIFFVFMAGVAPTVSVTTRRLIDLKLTKYYAILLFVPIFNVILLAILTLPGQSHHGS